jgi:hypothetical protein
VAHEAVEGDDLVHGVDLGQEQCGEARADDGLQVRTEVRGVQGVDPDDDADA